MNHALSESGFSEAVAKIAALSFKVSSKFCIYRYSMEAVHENVG